MAIVRDELVAASYQRQLVSAMWSRTGVYPYEKAVSYAYAERELLLGRLGQNRIDYVDVT